MKHRTCAVSGKIRYPDEHTARAVAAWKIEHNEVNVPLSFYKCPSCHGWHLTRKKRRGRDRDRFTVAKVQAPQFGMGGALL